MGYGLPKSIEIEGKSFEIRYDFRVILEIFEALNDPELDGRDRALSVLQMFYVDWENLPDFEKAIDECFKFINGGASESGSKKAPKLVSWQQDFPYIAAPVNRVMGCEVRGIEYDIETNTGGLHWWTFLAAYYEIGDCFFAQIVRIRDKKAKGQKLDKADREFYRKNQSIIDIKTQYSQEEDDLVRMWTAK